MIQNFGGRKFWQIWQIARDLPKFSCPNFLVQFLQNFVSHGTSLINQVLIFSKVAACTGRSVVFDGHPRTFDRPQKQASEKADQSAFGSGVVIIS